VARSVGVRADYERVRLALSPFVVIFSDAGTMKLEAAVG
jgi:hypothetical protein